jgi:cystathionine beta-lyase/cystathionine gamma-synthase
MTANPFECWLCLRGLATLAVRVQRACATALDLAERLQRHPSVRAVHYPGLPSHPDHRRAVELFAGRFGTIATLDLGDRAAADRFIRAVGPAIPLAPSLGDTATTLSHPATTSHRAQSAELWRSQGITPGLVRLSIGLEHPDDLWSELHAALQTLSF